MNNFTLTGALPQITDTEPVADAGLVARDIAVLYQTITFRVKENGNSGSLPVAEVFRFKGGKVVEWRALYFDSDMVAKALTGGE